VEPLVVQIENAYDEVERGLSDPELQGDRVKLRELGRRHKRLSEAHALARRWRELHGSLEEARSMLAAGETDPEMKAYLEGEAAIAEEALPPLEEELRAAMLEPDPDDDRDVIVEIRAGAGGDEAALFAGDVYHMLTSYAEAHGYKHETLDASPSDAGGFKSVTFEVRGEGAYSLLKWESVVLTPWPPGPVER
jgi:peptide chain release factor 1